MVDEHERLLSEIMPWWKSNGWNPVTLKRKNTYELLAIRTRMLYGKR